MEIQTDKNNTNTNNTDSKEMEIEEDIPKKDSEMDIEEE